VFKKHCLSDESYVEDSDAIDIDPVVEVSQKQKLNNRPFCRSKKFVTADMEYQALHSPKTSSKNRITGYFEYANPGKKYPTF
jgi:hypothetical protein